MAEFPADPWQTLSADIFSGMRDWRAQHPHATFREIELELGRPAGPLLQNYWPHPAGRYPADAKSVGAARPQAVILRTARIFYAVRDAEVSTGIFGKDQAAPTRSFATRRMTALGSASTDQLHNNPSYQPALI